MVPGERISGVPLADAEQGATFAVLRFENEAEELLHLFKDAGLNPAARARLRDDDGGHRRFAATTRP